MKREINYDRLQIITCGVIDQRYGQCMYGTHHAVLNGRTLCGQNAYEHETHGTMWFNLESLPDQERADESVTCHACRRSLGLEKRHGDSRVLL